MQAPVDGLAEIFELASEADSQELLHRYAGPSGNPALQRVLEVAQACGTQTVLIENRYIDADWRSELSNFFGTTFRRYSSVTDRLHFFSARITSLDQLSSFRGSYLGYSVMRPLSFSPVGRTLLRPPPEMDRAQITRATETVHLFGTTFEASGVPFISQDKQFLICAHACMWMVLRHAHLAHGVSKVLPADIQRAALGGVVVGRQVPHDGLSLSQILHAMNSLGLSPGRLAVPKRKPSPKTRKRKPSPKTPDDLYSLYAILCRYVNSNLPPIVTSRRHSWVIVGWQYRPSKGHPKLTLYRHDDMEGPYLRVKNPWKDSKKIRRPWMAILPPLLPKMFMGSERAELAGRLWLKQCAELESAFCAQSNSVIRDGQLTFRTYAVENSALKSRLEGRGMPADLVQMLKSVHMSHWVWVVEAIDRRLRDDGKPDVLGELILDATMPQSARLADPGIIALHLDSFAMSIDPDTRSLRLMKELEARPYLSDLHMSNLNSPQDLN